MTTRLSRWLGTLALTLILDQAAAQPISTAFTFQGQLLAGGAPANGLYDLRFRLFDAASGGNTAGPLLCMNNVSVTDGRFTALLDFGPQFTGQTRYLELEVRPDAGTGCADPAGFTTLAPRQELTSAPNAIYAQATSFSLNSLQLNGQPPSHYLNAANLSGTLPSSSLAGVYSSSLTFPNAGNQFAGSFGGTHSGNGSGLNQLSASAVTTGLLSPARGGTGANTTGAAVGSVLKWDGLAWTPGADLNFAPVIGDGLLLSANTLSVAPGGVQSSMLAAGAVTASAVLNGSLLKDDLAIDISFFNYMSSGTMYSVQGRFAFGPGASTDAIPDYTLVVHGTAQVQSNLVVDGTLTTGGPITTPPQTRTKVLSPTSFSTQSDGVAFFRASNGMYGTAVGFTNTFEAALDLPDGSTIVSVKFWYSDTSATDLPFGMGFQDFSVGGAFSCGANVLSTGNAVGTSSVTFVPTSHQTVDHAGGVHTITANWTVPATPSTMQLEGALVTYTTTGTVQ